MSQKVFVGLSGGVDSAVSAALLKHEGYDVTGCFIKIWQPEFIECTWREDRLDAIRVCASLGIPFKEIDLSDEYKREVVDPMVAEYARGITPNPDVLCNRAIKFGHFFAWARKEGADTIATGHYAQIRHESGHSYLARGADSAKDQSYFLWQVREEELAHTMFPIGGMKKTDVRALAHKFGLPNAEKPDSQGLCFVGTVSMDEFLGRYITLAPGVALEEGRPVGTHRGAARYTPGQRHGFSIDNTDGGEPYYVVETDVKENTISVSPDRSRATKKEVSLRDVHWINGKPSFPFDAQVQARYREVPIRAHIENHGSVRVTFSEPHLVSPGQSLVVYDEERCIGGGVIE